MVSFNCCLQSNVTFIYVLYTRQVNLNIIHIQILADTYSCICLLLLLSSGVRAEVVVPKTPSFICAVSIQRSIHTMEKPLRLCMCIIKYQCMKIDYLFCNFFFKGAQLRPFPD